MSDRVRLKGGTRLSTCVPSLSPETLEASRQQATRTLVEFHTKREAFEAKIADLHANPDSCVDIDLFRRLPLPVAWCPCCQKCSALSSFWGSIPKQGTCESCPPREHTHQDIPTLEEALQTPQWDLQSVEISVIVRELKTRIALEGVSERFSVHSFESWTKTNADGETVLHVQLHSRGPTNVPALDLIGHEVYTLIWQMDGGILPPAQWPIPITLARWTRRVRTDHGGSHLQHDIELPPLISPIPKAIGEDAAGVALQKFITTWGRLLGRPPKNQEPMHDPEMC